MFKKNVKQGIGIILILVIVMTGCSGKGNEILNEGKNEEVEETLYNAPGELPIVKEPITLKIFAPANGEYSWADNPQTKEIEEATGINIEWQIAASSDNIQTKISTIFASGDLPDVIFTGVSAGNRFDKATEQSFGLQGLVIPLNTYLDNVSVGYQAAFESVPGMKEYMTAPNGDIYSLPNLDASLHVQYPMKYWLNHQWLNNLGLEEPTTVEGLEVVLRAFKEQDANGNGNVNDEIPLSTVVQGAGVQIDGFLMAPFQLTPDKTKMYVENDKIVYAPIQKGYQEGLIWLNSLYKEGLIYPESFTQDRNTQVNLNEVGNEAVIGSFLAQRPGYAADLVTYPNNSKKWEQYQSVAPLKGKDGQVQAAWDPYVQYQTGMVYITNQCEYPEAAFRLIDYLATEEMTMRSAVGIKGVNWREAVDGELGLDGEQATYARQDADTENVMWGQLAGLVRTEKMLNNEAVAQDSYADNVKPLLGRNKIMYDASIEHEAVRQPYESVLPDLYMDSESAFEMSLLKTTINDIQVQLMTQMIIGDLDPVKDWEQYIRQLEASGLTRYIEILQEAYDASIYSK